MRSHPDHLPISHSNGRSTLTANGRSTTQSSPPWFTEDDDEGILLDIDDLLVPQAVKEHGACFRNPVRCVHDFGEGAYLLYSQEGEYWTS
jgi:hypothetical protein